MTASFWNDVLAAGTFNSPDGRMVQREARKKLAKLPANLPPDLVRRVFAFYRIDAPYDLWPCIKHLRAEHVDPLVAELADDPCIQARFVVAAHEQGGAVGLARAGGLLAMIARTTHLASCWRSLAKHWATLDPPALANAIAVALEAHGGPPDLTEVLAFFGFVYVLARTRPDAPVLDSLEKASANWREWNGIMERTRQVAAEAASP